MKKICLMSFSLLIFLSSFSISFTKSDLAFAHDPSLEADLEPVNYELPYPGLLPGHPLYFLRILRDKTVGFLISDPLKKAEFNLLQADKRLNAGIALFNRHKTKESLTIISKAENYFEEAISKIREARGQGMDVTEVTNKIVDSSKKHEEVLKSLTKGSSQDFKDGFNSQLQRVIKFHKEVEAFLLEIGNNVK